MHFSRILTAVVVTCATGALAIQLTVDFAAQNMDNLARFTSLYIETIERADPNDLGNVSKASQVS